MKRLPYTRRNLLVMAALLSLFAVYNLCIYKVAGADHQPTSSAQARAGKQLWQTYNCNSCHQLYGLGGYLGPDLTNLCSTPGKSPEYIKALLDGGIQSMPRFHFNETEKEALVAFLKEVDRTGHYPNYEAAARADGWVEIRYKHER